MTTADIIAELAKRNEELEREVARLRGVIEGMGKRPASPFPAPAYPGPEPLTPDPGTWPLPRPGRTWSWPHPTLGDLRYAGVYAQSGDFNADPYGLARAPHSDTPIGRERKPYTQPTLRRLPPDA